MTRTYPIAMMVLLAAFLHGCKSDPRMTLYQNRTREVQALILQRHGRELSQGDQAVILGPPEWFQVLDMEGRDPVVGWVWLISRGELVRVDFAGRVNEPIDPQRVTITFDNPQDLDTPN